MGGSLRLATSCSATLINLVAADQKVTVKERIKIKKKKKKKKLIHCLVFYLIFIIIFFILFLFFCAINHQALTTFTSLSGPPGGVWRLNTKLLMFHVCLVKDAPTPQSARKLNVALETLNSFF